MKGHNGAESRNVGTIWFTPRTSQGTFLLLGQAPHTREVEVNDLSRDLPSQACNKPVNLLLSPIMLTTADLLTLSLLLSIICIVWLTAGRANAIRLGRAWWGPLCCPPHRTHTQERKHVYVYVYVCTCVLCV